jgi:peroxidase
MPILPDPDRLLRLTESHYGDDISALTDVDVAVDAARTLFDQATDMPSSAGFSLLLVYWGQFIDHDLSLTRDASGEIIDVPDLVGPFHRSNYDPDSGTSPENPRAPVNEVTPGLDASMIYGSTSDRLADLRSHEGGRLRMSDGALEALNLLPLAAEGEVMAGAEATEAPIFLAGDVRANENINLLALQTLFMREHNYWADHLAALYPQWDDESLFNAARSIVEYEIQWITYSTWLPMLLAGNDVDQARVAAETNFVSPDGEVDGQISVEFSTAAFRVGHTMVSDVIALLEESGQDASNADFGLADAFFNTTPLIDGNMDPILRGLAAVPAQEIDGKVIDALNFFLLAPDGVRGFSLPALNILRGQDHGLGKYLEIRAALLGDLDLEGIAPSDFGVITSDPDVQADLAAVYDTVFDVGLWVGGLVEDRPDNAPIGPLFAYILQEQFHRTQISDQSFLELPDSLDPDLASALQQTSLADIIQRNTGIDILQADVFQAVSRIPGTDAEDMMGGSDASEILHGLDGDDLINGEGGADILVGGPGNDTVAGGQGNDTAIYSGSQNRYHVEVAEGGISITDRHSEGDGTDRLESIENLAFSQGDWALHEFTDVLGVFESDFTALAELYTAYFNRAPDSKGLLFWASKLGDGMALDEIAVLFFEQTETQALYPTSSSSEVFAKTVYQNVLGREFDPEGLEFWVSMLESEAVSRPMFILQLVRGAKAPVPSDADPEFKAQKAADMAHLAEKSDLGLYFSAIKGMSNVDSARSVMETYDGAGTGLTEAKALIETFYADALDPVEGEFLISLTGVLDDPFAGM